MRLATLPIQLPRILMVHSKRDPAAGSTSPRRSRERLRPNLPFLRPGKASCVHGFGRTAWRRALLGAALVAGCEGTALLAPRPALAQELAPNCPLPVTLAANFKDSTCTKTTLPASQTFYRYFHSPQNRIGRYLTTDRFSTNVDAIAKLALHQDWGNRAERELSVTLPAGTVVYQGVVGPQTPASCYPGGAQQTFIENSKDPAIVWTDGPALTLLQFQCSQP